MSQTKAQLIDNLVQALNFTGTASAPANGLFLSAANTLALATNSGQRLTIDSNGRVMIGTTTLGHSNSDDLTVNNSGNCGITIRSGSSNDGNIFFADADSNTIGTLKYDHTNNAFRINTNGSERLRIDTSGNVGIGTTSPSDKLHVRGASAAFTAFILDNTTNSSSPYKITYGDQGQVNHLVVANRELTFGTSNTERVRIDSSGKVGIGTTSPSSGLQLSRSAGDTILELNRTNTNTTGNVGLINFTASDGHSVGSIGMVGDGNDEGGEIVFKTTSAAADNSPFNAATPEHMRLKSDGDLLLTRATAGGGNETLLITANYGAGSDQALQASNSLRFYSNGANERMRIASDGNIGIGTTSPTYTNALFGGSQRTFHLSGTAAPQLRIKSSTSGQADLLLQAGNSGSTAYIANAASGGDLFFSTNNGGSQGTRLAIKDDGKVGIGTTNIGSHQLIVQGGKAETAGSSTALKTASDASGTLSDLALYGTFVTPTNDQGTRRTADIVSGFATANWGNEFLAFRVGKGGSSNDTEQVCDERMRVTGGGNILIGTTTEEDTTGNSGPKLIHTGDLQIDGDQKSILFRSTNSTAQKQSGIEWWNENGAGVQCAIFGIREAVSQAPSTLAFYTTNNVDTSSNSGQGNITNRMVINSAGEFRVQHEGNSDAVVSSDQVHGIGNSSLDSVTSNLARLCMQERQGDWISFRDGSGTHYGTISRSGSNVVYGGQSSDYRIKENIVNVSNGITLLKQLRPVNFNYTSDSGFTTEEQATVRIGFIAHEYAEVCPTGVIGEKDGMDIWGDCTDSEGKLTQKHVPESKKVDGETWTEKSRTPNYQQVDFSKAVPVLTAALQEAISKIETLETKVAALEAA